VTRAGGALQRLARALRRSLTAQITLAVTLVSGVIILLVGLTMDRILASELREESELLLLSSLMILREDLAAAGNDPAAVPRLVARAVQRTRRLQAEVVDEQQGRLLAKSPRFRVPPAALPPQALAAGTLPSEATALQTEELAQRYGPLTTLWIGPDGVRYRLLRARLPLPAPQGQPPRALQITLAVETTPTRELRAHNRQNLAVALCVSAALAGIFGLAIAREIVVSVRRFGATASRIGASDLHERMPLEGAPTELVESTQAFNHMLDRLQNAFDRLSAFSSDLAHDLRTPLGNLLGEAQVALSRPRSAEEYRAVLESAVEEYERLSRMIGNMLFLARADRQPALAAHWVDLAEALQRVVGYFELLAEEHRVVLQMQVQALPGAEARVWADESMLVRAVSNLVSNALRYAPAGTSIQLDAQPATDGSCTIRVANDGPPIAPEHQPRIFERFYRADAARQHSASGSGLGLAIVRSILELHGGTAAVHSAPARPTVFVLRFPGKPVTPSS
jgi:two-component system heavy metal sensor histidine kinase CusS